ncbi:MAG: hypothetical protein ABJB03_00385 [Rhodoglobus sp.]
MNDLVNLAKQHVETRYGGDWLDAILHPQAGPGATSDQGGQAPWEADEWTLTFEYSKNPLPLNGSRGGHQHHSRLVKAVRVVAKREARWAGIPALGRCQVHLTWYVLSAGRRDPVNLSATLKALQDGLVDAGVVVDDTPDLMNTIMPAIVRVDRMKHTTAWMELIVRRWEGPGA